MSKTIRQCSQLKREERMKSGSSPNQIYLGHPVAVLETELKKPIRVKHNCAVLLDGSIPQNRITRNIGVSD